MKNDLKKASLSFLSNLAKRNGESADGKWPICSTILHQPKRPMKEQKNG